MVDTMVLADYLYAVIVPLEFCHCFIHVHSFDCQRNTTTTTTTLSLLSIYAVYAQSARIHYLCTPSQPQNGPLLPLRTWGWICINVTISFGAAARRQPSHPHSGILLCDTFKPECTSSQPHSGLLLSQGLSPRWSRVDSTIQHCCHTVDYCCHVTNSH